MRYLLDTNHWSYLQEGHESVLRRFNRLAPEDELFMSVVVQAELLAGVELLPEGKRKRELRLIYEQTLDAPSETLPVDSRIAERFAMVLAQLRREGHPIETNDMWIAASALVHDMVLVTNDDHFQYVSGLRTENWME